MAIGGPSRWIIPGRMDNQRLRTGNAAALHAPSMYWGRIREMKAARRRLARRASTHAAPNRTTAPGQDADCLHPSVQESARDHDGNCSVASASQVAPKAKARPLKTGPGRVVKRVGVVGEKFSARNPRGSSDRSIALSSLLHGRQGARQWKLPRTITQAASPRGERN